MPAKNFKARKISSADQARHAIPGMIVQDKKHRYWLLREPAKPYTEPLWVSVNRTDGTLLEYTTSELLKEARRPWTIHTTKDGFPVKGSHVIADDRPGSHLYCVDGELYTKCDNGHLVSMNGQEVSDVEGLCQSAQSVTIARIDTSTNLQTGFYRPGCIPEKNKALPKRVRLDHLYQEVPKDQFSLLLFLTGRVQHKGHYSRIDALALNEALKLIRKQGHRPLPKGVNLRIEIGKSSSRLSTRVAVVVEPSGREIAMTIMDTKRLFAGQDLPTYADVFNWVVKRLMSIILNRGEYDKISKSFASRPRIVAG